MSGVPPQPPNGAHPSGASKSAIPLVRRRPQPNILVANRKIVKPKIPLRQSPTPAEVDLGTANNSKASTTSAAKVTAPPAAARNGAFTQRPPSPEPQGKLTKTPVFLTKKALLEGFRHHVARMQAKAAVDITDQSKFTRPVRLHRRDPNARFEEEIETSEVEEPSPKDEALGQERERVEAIKAEQKRLRQEAQKLIAPSITTILKKKRTKKRQFQQIFRPNDTPEEKKKNQLRYEEAFPWHVEDFDNRQTWTGTYEQTLSECHLLLTRDGNNARIVPLEKYYRFKERTKAMQINFDKVNDIMTGKTKEPKFIAEKRAIKEREEQKRDRESHRRFAKKGGARFGGSVKTGVKNEEEDALFANDDVPEGAEEMDFENDDLFDDDEEDPLLEGDNEDVLKERLSKIKKEQLGANIFDMVDEEDVDKEEEEEVKRTELTKKTQKKMKRALLKREQNFNYEDDSEPENPYNSETEEEETAAEEEADDEKSPEKKGNVESTVAGDTTPSGRKKNGSSAVDRASLKRTTDVEMSEASGNESSRAQKNRLKVPNLKRPGSPDVSGLSGNESSRKKQKLSGLHSNIKVAQNRKVSALRAGAGSGSESETSKRLNSKSKGTPSGSRAASPSAQSTGSGRVSRSGSPSADAPMPTVAELTSAIPADGISLMKLAKLFSYGTNAERISQVVKFINRNAQVQDGRVFRKS